MNKKRIILSLSIIVAVAAVVVGATAAYFGDTETSTGNTFTAGSIDLKIDSQSHYAGLVCDGAVWVDDPNNSTPTTRPDLVNGVCGGTWAEADLGGHVFYSFADLKPGDQGENTISIHVYDNDAWLQYRSDNAKDFENECNEAEAESGDTSCGAEEGELSGNLDWHVWLDQGEIPGFQNIGADGKPIESNPNYDETEGDNIQNGLLEFTVLGGDEIDNVPGDGLYPFRYGEQYFFAESLAAAYEQSGCQNEEGDNDYGSCQGLAADGRIVGSTTYYFGTAWCLGTFDDGVDGALNAPVSCDGSTVSNQAQSDSLVSDSVYEVVQHRNNPGAGF